MRWENLGTPEVIGLLLLAALIIGVGVWILRNTMRW